jgi:hypothetical protein
MQSKFWSTTRLRTPTWMHGRKIAHSPIPKSTPNTQYAVISTQTKERAHWRKKSVPANRIQAVDDEDQTDTGISNNDKDKEEKKTQHTKTTVGQSFRPINVESEGRKFLVLVYTI